MEKELIVEAYETGKRRGTSLSLGYFVSPDHKTVFCQNPNSPEGVFVGEHEGFGDIEHSYQRFDMSEALAAIAS